MSQSRHRRGARPALGQRGKRGVTAATAIRLASLLGTSPGLWLNLQTAWDLWWAYRSERRRGPA